MKLFNYWDKYTEKHSQQNVKIYCYRFLYLWIISVCKIYYFFYCGVKQLFKFAVCVNISKAFALEEPLLQAIYCWIAASWREQNSIEMYHEECLRVNDKKLFILLHFKFGADIHENNVKYFGSTICGWYGF